MRNIKEIGLEINEVLSEEIPLEEKTRFTYGLISSVMSSDKKPTYELWERAIKDMSSNLNLETITNHISLLTLVEPTFSTLPHMEIHAFLRKINPEAKKVRVSAQEEREIKKTFNSFLKKTA